MDLPNTLLWRKVTVLIFEGFFFLYYYSTVLSFEVDLQMNFWLNLKSLNCYTVPICGVKENDFLADSIECPIINVKVSGFMC